MTYKEFKAWLFIMEFSRRYALPNSNVHQLKDISVYIYDRNKNISVYLTSGKRLSDRPPDTFKELIEKELLREEST